jgi:hypothetical protein
MQTKNNKSTSFYSIVTLLAVVTLASVFMSFTSTKQVATQYMHVNVLESTIGGGVGRSRILITDASGKRETLKIKNYYSITGVNFSNIAGNDKALVILLNKLAQEGWEVVSTTSAVAASGERGGGIFATKYLLKK